MTRKRDRFLADALHQVAIGSDYVRLVIDGVVAEFGGEMLLGDSHAYRVGESLSKWAGGRFDARRMAELGMAGCDRPKLAELLDLLDRHCLVAGQVEQCVDQHRAVA